MFGMTSRPEANRRVMLNSFQHPVAFFWFQQITLLTNPTFSEERYGRDLPRDFSRSLSCHSGCWAKRREIS